MSKLLGYVRRNHLGLLALFIALGGTSYAAVALPRNSVGTAQIKTGAVASSDVRDGALRLRDFDADERAALRGAAGRQGAAGPMGPAGAAGPGGAAGATGPPGPPATADLKLTQTGAHPNGSNANVPYSFKIENRGPDPASVALELQVGWATWASALPSTGRITCVGDPRASGDTVLFYGPFNCMAGQVAAGETLTLNLNVVDCGTTPHTTHSRLLSSAIDPTPGDQASSSTIGAVSCAG